MDALLEGPLMGKANVPDRSLHGVFSYLKQMGLTDAEPDSLEAPKLLELLQRTATGPDTIVDLEGLNTVKNIVDRWSSRGLDILQSDPWEAAGWGAHERTLHDLGATTKFSDVPIAGDLMKLMNSLWASEVLSTVATNLTNVVSGLTFAGMQGHGDLWRKNLGMMWHHFRKMSNPPGKGGENWMPDEVQAFIQDHEVNPPSSLVTSYANAMLDVMGDGRRTLLERTPAWKRMATGAAMGMASPAPMLTAPYGALVGAAAPTLARIGGWVRTGIEQSFRIPIWQKVVQQHKEQALPRFLDDLARELNEGTSRVLGSSFGEGATGPAIINGMNVSPGAHTRIPLVLEELAATGGRFGPRVLAEKLEGLATPEVIDRFTKQWSDINEAGSRAGLAEANRVHFPYGETTKTEEVLRDFFPFMNWARHAAPAFFNFAVTHPAIITALIHYGNLSESERLKAGLPSSYIGQVPAGEWTKGVSGALLGQPGEQLWVNPLRLVTPFGETMGNTARASQSDNLLAAGLSGLSGVGMGLSGPWMSALTSTGALGPDAASPGMFRHAPLIASLPLAPAVPGGGSSWREMLGGLAEGVGSSGESGLHGIRRAFGQDPFDATRYAVEKRLDEMSMEQVGQVGNAQYMAAKHDPNSALYQQALGDVLRAQVGRTFASLLSPVGAHPVSTTEAAIRRESQFLPQGPRDTQAKIDAWEAAQQEHPVGAAYSGSSGQEFEGRLYYLASLIDNPMPLFPGAPPSVGQLWAQYRHFAQKARELGVPVSQLAPSLVQNPVLHVLLRAQEQALSDPLWQHYQAWRATFHPNPRAEGEQALIAQFLQQTGGR